MQILRNENSFDLFNALLAMHFKRCTSTNSLGLCQKIKGRILPKFTLNKIMALNEYGLKHFSTIFLTMGLVTNLKDLVRCIFYFHLFLYLFSIRFQCDKLQELLLQLPFTDLQWNKKFIVIKMHLVILQLYSENGISIKTTALPVKHLIASHSNSRDTESMNFIKTIFNGCLDIIDASNGFQNDEHILIGIKTLFV
jgi:hypothetical protein